MDFDRHLTAAQESARATKTEQATMLDHSAPLDVRLQAVQGEAMRNVIYHGLAAIAYAIRGLGR